MGGWENTLGLMKQLIQMVQPDCILLTGDNVMSTDTRKAWITLTNVLVEAKIPWAIVFGNHDQEYGLTKLQIIEILSDLPYNLTENGPEDVSGNGNYILKIASSKSPQKTAAALYCLDSKQLQDIVQVQPGKQSWNDWDWISFDQIDWYRKQSSILTAQNGGEPLPALAFFHIPIPEYNEVVDKPTTVGLKQEVVCSPPVNSGLFTALCERKDVMGIFVGHDHTNNYIGCLHNICLAYGNSTGQQASGNSNRGCRVIELYEGERKFDTWLLQLYERNGWKPIEQVEPLYLVTYPDSFKREEK
jgi:hypothetical protein